MTEWLARRLAVSGCEVNLFYPDGDHHPYPQNSNTENPIPANILFSWGDPQIVFCTHYDTVPPYIPPTVSQTPDGKTIIRGRGSCDAKGQIFAMYSACLELAERGESGFGLLLLYGEEVGSLGAKVCEEKGRVVIVGEPTDNCMVSASKGTKSFSVKIKGRPCHSGYPEQGSSAVEKFVDLMNKVRAMEIPVDPNLGETTYNVGLLSSPNPQNILSPEVNFRIYFRTTFASDEFVCKAMAGLSSEDVEVVAHGGDTPMEYLTLEGFATKTVAFGSDAPQLKGYRTKALCGPGSILVAHRDEEFVSWEDLERARDQYVEMYYKTK